MAANEIEEKLRKLASIAPNDAQAVWLLYLLGEGKERSEAEELIDIALFESVGKSYPKGIFLEPPARRECDGEYRLGSVIYPPGFAFCPFGLREEEWIQHVLITGITGAGKTNLMFVVLREFARHKKPFLIFDWKRNYRDLLQFPAFSALSVYTVGREIAPFRFNPLLPPPGALAGEWLMKLVDVIKHAYFVGEGVEFLLREAFDATYFACGYFDGSHHTTPTFHQVKARVMMRRVSGRMMLWKASALRTLESLCFRHGLGPVVNSTKPWDHNAFLAAGVVLELDALSDSDKVFLTEAMILWLYELRKNEGRRETFKHALVIEEAHHVLSHHKENALGAETIMETCLRQIREFGEAVIAIDQEPTKLSNSIKANTATKITFNLGNGKDILDMATCMGLDLEEMDYLKLLGVGQAIVSRKAQSGLPVQVTINHLAPRKAEITDKNLRGPGARGRDISKAQPI